MKTRLVWLGATMIVFSFPASAQKKLSERKKADTPKSRVVVKKNPQGMPLAKFKSTDYESERVLHDSDKDGWCDLWCSLNPGIKHRNKRTDSDGDGLTDYEEMVLMKNAMIKDPRPRKLTAAEIAERNKKVAQKKPTEEQKRARKILQPLMHSDFQVAGKPFSVEASKKAKREALKKIQPDIEAWQQAKIEAANQAAKNLGIPTRFKLPDGGDAVAYDAENGVPKFLRTRSISAADTISTDELWPGGSSGFNLTGQRAQTSLEQAQNIEAPSVTIGVWEPSGLVVDHPEFEDNSVTVDTLDSLSGWSSSSGGSLAVLNGGCPEGTGCLGMGKSSGSTSVLYSRTQSSAQDFRGQTILVWYFINERNDLALTDAVQLRYGSASGAYWQRTFTRANLRSGFNLLSMKIETATEVQGAPDELACDYTALNVNFADSNDIKATNQQATDFWRLSNTRVTNMDRASSVSDHSTHTTGLMVSRGVDANARGMAFEADVHSRDALLDLAEMSAIFTNDDPTDNIFTSNHSYGPEHGWVNFPTNGGTATFLDVSTGQTSQVTVNAGNYRFWSGDSSVSPNEDFAFGFYTNELSAMIDATVYSSETILPVWAAGNERGSPAPPANNLHFEVDPVEGFVYTNSVRLADGGNNGFDTLPADSVAKNILTVGSVADLTGGFTGTNPAVSSFSSFGPTDDGRIKPDVCANGESVFSAAYAEPGSAAGSDYTIFSGTSEAAPTVAGTIGLLVELLRQTRGDSYEPPASLLKGTIIHTADDILNAGPDAQSGYGLVNALSAADLISTSETEQHGQNIRMVVLQDDATVTIPVTALGGVPLKVTVCSTDPAGTATANVLDPATPMLINDFSLSVTQGAQTFHPFSLDRLNPNSLATTTGPNDVDNVEQVLVASPILGGNYNVVLSAPSGENFVDGNGDPAPQEVAVIISGIEADPSLELKITSVTQTDSDKFTIVWPALIGSPYRVQQSLDLSTGSWTDITGDIVAGTSFVARELTSDPDTIGKNFWRVRKVK